MSLSSTSILIDAETPRDSTRKAVVVAEVPGDEDAGCRQHAQRLKLAPWCSWLLLASDMIMIQASVAISAWIWGGWSFGEWPGEVAGLLSVIVIALHLGYALAGLYATSGVGSVERLRRRTLVTFGGFAGLAFLSALTAGPSIEILVTAGLLALGLCPICDEWLRIGLRRLGVIGMPVVVIGAGLTGKLVIETLQSNPTLGMTPVAAFDDDPRKHGGKVAGVPVLGRVGKARTFAGTVDMAILAMPGVGSQRLSQLLPRLPFPRVLVVPDLFGVASVGVSGCDLAGILGLQISRPLQMKRYWAIKRAMDLLIAIPMFLIAIIPMCLAGLLIFLLDRGSPIFMQERVGLGGRMFNVYKLRSMYHDADDRLNHHLATNPEADAEWRRFYKLKSDPRVLPYIGHALRRTSFDEFPQLWNVIKGDMSLVGPRPFPLYHLSSFPPRFRTLRRSVRPGLTGMWQVCVRNDGDIHVQEAMDTYYIRNWSIWLDLHLLARTFHVVLRMKGAC